MVQWTETPAGRFEIQRLLDIKRTIFFCHTNTQSQISVIIFYSHMLHFALNVQVTLSDQTQKVWVSTYSNVLYSLFIRTGQPQKLPVNNLHPLFVGYLVAVIYKVSSAKEKFEQKLGKQKKRAACTISRGGKKKQFLQVLTVLTSPRSSTKGRLKTQTSAVCCWTLNIMDLCLQARVDKFPLFQKNRDDDDDPKKGGRGGK